MTDGQKTRRMILIVDDDGGVLNSSVRYVRMVLKEARADETVEVWKARHRQDAIAQAEFLKNAFGSQARFLLITDGNMPGGNGDEVVTSLRELLGSELVESVLTTGSVEYFRPICDELGIRCFEKPVRDELAPIIRRFLACE